MAPGRGGHQDRRGAALAVACRGSERDGAGRAGPEPARQASRQAPAAQAAEAPVPGAPCDDHRQARQLRRGKEGADAGRRAPPAQGSQQPGGKLAPADATTRAADEALQVGRPSTAFPLRSRPDQQSLPSPPRPRHRQRVPRREGACVRGVGRHQRGCCRSVNSVPASPSACQLGRTRANNLTVPPRHMLPVMVVHVERRQSGRSGISPCHPVADGSSEGMIAGQYRTVPNPSTSRGSARAGHFARLRGYGACLVAGFNPVAGAQAVSPLQPTPHPSPPPHPYTPHRPPTREAEDTDAVARPEENAMCWMARAGAVSALPPASTRLLAPKHFRVRTDDTPAPTPTPQPTLNPNPTPERLRKPMLWR